MKKKPHPIPLLNFFGITLRKAIEESNRCRTGPIRVNP